MAASAGPSRDDSLTAIAKCVAMRRANHRDDPQHAAMTASAITERVHGLLVPTHRGPEAWWLVGRLVDEIDHREFHVWFNAEHGHPALSPRGRHIPVTPPRPSASPDQA